ncbi:MAG: phenylpyruvate tautomerase PptA (4-oxalocrotonate tautomerase family), partial [Oleiphilaceae bacterium]
MPLIRITAQEGTFDKATQNKFIEEVTDAVLTAEGADPKDPAAQSLAWAYYTEQQQGDIYIGKENIDTPPVLIRVTTPAGALDQAANNALAKSINDIINDFIGIFDGRLNHWLLIDEIPTTGWASNGIIF